MRNDIQCENADGKKEFTVALETCWNPDARSNQ